MNRYPFLYAILDKSDFGKVTHYVVVIGNPIHYVHTDTEWMEDEDLPSGRTLRADVDLGDEQHTFQKEEDTMKYIQNWWHRQVIPDNDAT